MRRLIIGWFYGFTSADSFVIRIFKAIVSMFFIYSLGILAYLLFVHGFMDFSWLSLAAILIPVIFSWYAGIDVFLKNPTSVRLRGKNPKQFFFRSVFVGALLFVLWLLLTIVIFDFIFQS